MSPRGLGRGLGALIPAGPGVLDDLPVGDIQPNPRQPRRHFDEETLEGLAASIRQVGLLQPVVVRPGAGGRYELVVGERRWRAAERAGLATVPAIVVETDDRGALERALVENVHRRDLNAIEEAAAYQQLLDEGGLTHEELGRRLGLSRPVVTNALRLLDLPPGVQRLVVEGRLSAGHGRALVPLASDPLAERVAQEVAAAGMSVRETERLVRRRGAALPGRGAPGARRAGAPGAAELAERLSEALGTRVGITLGARGKGRMVVEFGSAEDLKRISAAILRSR